MSQWILSASLFGFAACVAWWVAALLLRDEDAALRRRLGSDFDGGRDEPPSRLKVLLERMLGAAAAPFTPRDERRRSALRVELGHAGIYAADGLRAVLAMRFVLLVAGIGAGYAIGAMLGQVLAGLSFGGLAGYALPSMWLKARIRGQRRALELALPDALDLMVVCVEAGLTVDAAMQRVAMELALAHPRLAREMEITHMETRVGLARQEALRNLGRRSGCQALATLATMLIQAERFGTSIAQSLRVHADTLRTARQHAAEELAAKASVKLSFPVVLFIFPAVLIVLAGPAVIGLFSSALFE